MSIPNQVEDRARQSLGSSAEAIYRAAARMLKAAGAGGEMVVDLGCGTGAVWPHLRGLFRRYSGVDVVRYDGLPADAEFHKLDLDSGRAPLPDAVGDAVTAVEVIEHLENPRALFREMIRLAKPGGWIVVTTPNQLSWLSKLTFLTRHQFNAFTAANYPAHITALLEIDLVRMAQENGLESIQIGHSQQGRIPGTGAHFPASLSAAFPRAFSNNVLILARKKHV